MEPVMPIAESLNAIGFRQLRLLLTHLGDPQVVKSEIGRQPGLVVAGKQRPRSGDISPLGEPFFPPYIILGNGVVLGEIESDNPRIRTIFSPGDFHINRPLDDKLKGQGHCNEAADAQ